MWRRSSEAASPKLAGADPYASQVPLSRAIPLWGAISSRGFKEIVYHSTKKLNIVEWRDALQKGAMTRALEKLKIPGSPGPWRVLCDNESFMKSKQPGTSMSTFGTYRLQDLK